MLTELSPSDLTRVLPGSWDVRATNFPEWLDSATHSHLIAFEVVETQPLILRETVSFGVTGGQPQRSESTDRWKGRDFVRRSIKPMQMRASRWIVSGISADDNVIILRFAASKAVRAGLNVLVRTDSTAETRTRALVANNTEQFGLTIEDFASLGWFGGTN